MSPDHVKLVSISFGRVFPFRKHLVQRFYDDLFERAPNIRVLFPEDMTGQFDKLADTLQMIVSQMAEGEDIVAKVQALGKQHVRYGAQPEHFEAVGQSLIHALKSVTPGGLTLAEEEAWIAAYGTLSSIMIHAGRAAA